MKFSTLLFLFFATIIPILAKTLCDECVEGKKVFVILPNYSFECVNDESDVSVYKTSHKNYVSCKMAELFVEFGGKTMHF